ncbi:DUF3093 family protein [Streptomyces sp. NBC_01518]|uniref:DUF3093 family protein n=1 Tax=Streptomyces sp. NBC_01518 TaxID=2903891 RepID=UPI00386C0406
MPRSSPCLSVPAWRTYKADLRSFMVMRGFIPGAVRIGIVDPHGPTPTCPHARAAGRGVRRAVGRTPGRG